MTMFSEDPYPQSLRGYWCQLAAISTFDIRERLRTLQVPLVILAGSEDPLAPLACSETMAEQLPNAVLRVFEGCAHMHHMEFSQQFTDLIFETWC